MCNSVHKMLFACSKTGPQLLGASILQPVACTLMMFDESGECTAVMMLSQQGAPVWSLITE